MTHEDETLELSLKRKEAKVRITKEDNTVLNLVMKEITGVERDSYMTFMTKKMRIENGKSAGINDYMGVQSRLLSLCLYYEDEPNKRVSEQEIQGWTASVQDVLYKRAEKMNALDTEKAEAEAKND